MSIVKMSKISLAGLLTDRERIIARLMKLGLVEIISYDSRDADGILADFLSADSAEKKASELESDMNKTGAAIDIIERFSPEKKPMFYPGKKMRVDEYKMITSDLDRVRSIVARILNIDANLLELKNEENRLSVEKATLEPWRTMPLPLESGGTKNVRIIYGTIPAPTPIELVTDALALSAPESFLETVNSDLDYHYVVLIAHTDCEDAALQSLKTFGFQKAQFKNLTGSPDQIIMDTAARLSEIAAKRQEMEKQIKQLAPQKTRLQALYDYIEIRVARNRIVSKFGRTENLFFMEGWIPSESAAGVIAKMEAEADCYIEIAPVEKGEDHPILLNNPGIIKPFEAITAMYSLPSARDVDPNLLMTPFYFLFFGMMIGDFFYGIILSLIVGVMILRLKPGGMSGKMLKMLFLGGLSTAFWGLMFGSYFGNLPQALMGWITGNNYSDKFYGIWFDPITDPMRLLIFSMIFGVVHLFVGMGIKMFALIRDGEIFAAIFDIGSWYVLIIGLPLLLLGIFPGLYLTILGVAMLVLTQGRTAKNPIMKFLNGLLSLYGITGYLGDVLSYSRLLALGLATGVIAAVVNTLAMLNAPGFISAIVCLVVVAFGSVFNITINALGAFVHSSRLQYVEFFSKFYEGGGEAFKPFEIKTKYIKIT